MSKKVVFRVDCGRLIGSGHLMRCLALARIFKNINYQCFFVAYDFSKKIIEKEINKEFKIIYLNSLKYKKNKDQFEKIIFNHKTNIYASKEKYEFLNIIKSRIKNVEMIIVDHYGISYEWEKFIKTKYNKKLVIIDDYLNRPHFCDYLIDPTGQFKKNRNDKIKYVLSGTKYLILNKNFKKNKIYKKKYIFISFGSMDKLAMSLKILNVLIKLNLNYKIVVAISKFSKSYEKLSKYENENKIKICNKIKDLNYFINRSVFAIGAASTSAFERMYLQLPSLVFKTAINQKYVLKTLLKSNGVQVGNKNNIEQSLKKFIKSLNKLKTFNNIDNFGAERIVPNLVFHTNKLKFEFFQNNIEQKDTLFLMRNMSQHFSTSKITNTKIFYSDHNNWCNLIDQKNTDLIYLIKFQNTSIGYIRYHIVKNNEHKKKLLEVSIFIQDDLSNKNIGSYVLQFFNLLFNDYHIVAEISKSNKSSLNFFKKNNFSLKSFNKKIQLF